MRGTRWGIAAAMAVAGGAQAQDIGGTYAVPGTNLDGSPCGGTAQIAGNSDTTCTIAWTTGTTGSQGSCMSVGAAFAAASVQGEAMGLVATSWRRAAS